MSLTSYFLLILKFSICSLLPVRSPVWTRSGVSGPLVLQKLLDVKVLRLHLR